MRMILHGAPPGRGLRAWCLGRGLGAFCTGLAYERLIENLVAWANAQDDVRAAVVIGSRARLLTYPRL